MKNATEEPKTDPGGRVGVFIHFSKVEVEAVIDLSVILSRR